MQYTRIHPLLVTVSQIIWRRLYLQCLAHDGEVR